MPIVIPDEKFEEFLRSLLVRVTKVQEELVAEMRADVEAQQAVFRARLEAALARRVRAVEEELEKNSRAAEEALTRRVHALEDKVRAAEDEIARELERRKKIALEREVF